MKLIITEKSGHIWSNALLSNLLLASLLTHQCVFKLLYVRAFVLLEEELLTKSQVFYSLLQLYLSPSIFPSSLTILCFCVMLLSLLHHVGGVLRSVF